MRQLVEIYLPNSCSVLLNVAYIAASFVERYAALGYWPDRKRETSLQEVCVNAP